MKDTHETKNPLLPNRERDANRGPRPLLIPILPTSGSSGAPPRFADNATSILHSADRSSIFIRGNRYYWSEFGKQTLKELKQAIKLELKSRKKLKKNLKLQRRDK